MTIGADTALHRITEALDALRSTASSHQRTFVVEVMGRHCGYLALMASLATGGELADDPGAAAGPTTGRSRCARRSGPAGTSGRRQSVVHRRGGCAGPRRATRSPRTRSRRCWRSELGEDARITILGHVQRGGAPSAFDRYLATLLGHAAVERLLADDPATPAQLVGLRGNRVVSSPLMECVAQTQAVAERIKAHDFEGAMLLRGGSFRDSYEILRTMQQAAPRPTPAGRRRFRLAVVHGGGPAPGMNNCGAGGGSARPGSRLHACWPCKNGFRGLRDGDIQEMGWMDVSGWVSDRRRRDRHQPVRADRSRDRRRSPSRSPRIASTAC